MLELEENPTQYHAYILKFCPDYVRDESINVGLFLIYKSSDSDFDSITHIQYSYYDKIIAIFGEGFFHVFKSTADLILRSDIQEYYMERLELYWENPDMLTEYSYPIKFSYPLVGVENKPVDDIFGRIWKRYVE